MIKTRKDICIAVRVADNSMIYNIRLKNVYIIKKRL